MSRWLEDRPRAQCFENNLITSAPSVPIIYSRNFPPLRGEFLSLVMKNVYIGYCILLTITLTSRYLMVQYHYAFPRGENNVPSRSMTAEKALIA